MLLVDDDEAIRTMFSFGLSHHGFKVVDLADGEAAVRLLEESAPNLVLLDVQMPGLDGFGVLQALSIPRREGPHVVVFSNFSQPEDVRKAVDLGAIDWIVKASITPSMLAKRIEGWMEVIARYDTAQGPLDRARYRDPSGRDLDTSPHAMLIADDFARYVGANRPGLQLLGLEDLSELVGRSVWDVTPSPLLLGGLAAWREFLIRGEDAGSYQVLNARGQTVTINYVATANVEPGRHLSVHIG